MFVDRDANGNVTGLYRCGQFPDQEQLADNDPKAVAFLQALANPPITHVTPLQMRSALRQMGLIDQVNAYVVQQTPDYQDAWQYASTMPIGYSMLVAVASALKFDLNALFTLAATFP